jgi:hypothetical protein
MPISIDLDHITGPFRSIGAFQLTPIAYMFQRLGKWLDDRVKKADELEESSRGFPVVWIDGDAVQCWLDDIQRGALSPNGSPPGFWDQIRAIGAAFVAGLKRFPEMIANEKIIPRFLSTAAASLQAILDSVKRFETPTASTFDPALRTAGDLFGIAAMGFRAVLSSKEQILRFLFSDVLLSYLVIQGGKKEGAAPADPKSTTDMLDSVARYILGALMILPHLPELVGRLWESANIAIRNNTIEALSKREAKVFGLRRTIIDLFYVRFRDLIVTALAYVQAAGTVITMQATFWLAFVHLYGLRLLLDIRKIVDDVADYIFKVVAWIKDIFITSIDNILNFDLAPYIVVLLGGVPGWLLSKIVSPPPFTVLALIHEEAHNLLLTWIGETIALLSLGFPWTLPVQRRLIELGKVVHKVFSPVLPPLPEPAFSKPAPFPNIFDQWAKAAKASDIEKKFDDLSRQLPEELHNVIGAAADAMGKAGDRFDNLAAAAARGGSMEEYMALSGRAASLARNAFGPERQKLNEKLTEDQKDIVASSFESWLAMGGFELIGQFLEQYIAGMFDWFRKQESTGDELMAHITKTSPAILAKNKVLGRVLMQRLTIDARGRKLDGGLAQEIADRFRGAIFDAYATGQKELSDLVSSVAI